MNLSIILKIFREGILAALMGGFYIDFSENAHFINVVHIYLWLILFIVPILIVMNHSKSLLASLLAAMAISVLVLIIKLITYHLHYLFDTSEAIEIIKNTERSPKIDIEPNNDPLSLSPPNPPKAFAIDQESMFHNGSLEDVEMGLNLWEINKINIIDGKIHVAADIEQINDSNLERNKSTELCILDQASRRHTSSRVLPRVNNARSKIIDFRKSSCPAGPNQLLIQTNSSLNDKYCRLMNPRNTVEFYQNELEKMKREISQLRIVVQDDFIPSTADLHMLDLQPTSRKIVKSISRSRSSSQRHCHSVHINAATAASRVGSMRGNRLVVNDNDQPTNHTFVRHKSQRRQSVSSTRTRKALVQPVARSHSLKQTPPNEIAFPQFPPSSSNHLSHRTAVVGANSGPVSAGDIDGHGLPGRRTQSFRNEERPFITKHNSNSTRLDVRSSQFGQMVHENGDFVRRKSSFCNPRRQMRAASIDVSSSSMKPVFTIGNDNMGPPQSARAMRKASLDMKSRSLEVPEHHSDRGRLTSNLHLYKQNSFCVKSSNEHNEDPFFDREMSFTEENQSEIIGCTSVESNYLKMSTSDFDAMLAAQLSMEDDEINALLSDKDKVNIEEIITDQENTCNDAVNDKKVRLVRRNAINRGRPSVSQGVEPIVVSEVECSKGSEPQLPHDTIDNQEHSTALSLLPISGLNPATHEDTSEGSVHLFQDESGQWMVYVFGDDSGTAIPRRNYLEGLLGKSVVKDINTASLTKQTQDTMTTIKNNDFQRCDSPHPGMLSRTPLLHFNPTRRAPITARRAVETVEDTNVPSTSGGNYIESESSVRNRRSELQGRLSNASMEQISMLDRILMTDNTRGINNDQFDLLQSMLGPSANVTSPESLMLYDAIEKWFSRDKSQLSTKHYYYELALIPWSKKRFKVDFDRLQLTSLFDRSISKLDIFLSVILAGLVSIIGLSLLCRHLYHDMSLIIVCFTMASAQYSMLKSVQPDACSPQHGFNRILVFSRAVYFSVIAGSILILEILLENGIIDNGKPMTMFKIPISGVPVMKNISIFLQNLLLSLPLLHTLGLLPQLNTLFLFILEQLDIHLFGSSGSIDIVSAAASILRNLVALGVTYSLCYFGMKQPNPQNITYSLFWGFQLTTCYFLSRLPNSIHLYRCLLDHCPKLNISLPSVKVTIQRKEHNNNALPLDDMDKVVGIGPKSNISSPMTPEKSLNSKIPIKFDNSNSPTMVFNDPLPKFMSEHLLARMKNDVLVCIAWGVLGFALHISTLFTHSGLQYILKPLIIYTTVVIGFILHYLWPQLRKPYPWLLLTEPVLKPSENGQNTKAECCHYWLLWLLKNTFIPLLVLNEFTSAATALNKKFGSGFASIIIIVLSMKCLRNGFSATPRLYLVILLTHILFEYDLKHWDVSETFPVNYLLISILFTKLYELWLKMNFVFIYIAPFQISWGSAFHAVAQLAFLPHSMFLLTQCVLSSILSAPLEPFLASAIFLSSYIRPMKFWEQKYRTQRLETTNTALSSQVQGVSSEQVAGNLNSIFYEHLTRSLQKTLAGDLLLGRWGGAVEHGDMFILASEDLHFLVHIIEVGNGLVTFQLRGLEFAGTYCHEQETEELRTDLIKNRGFCCCNPGRLPRCLSLNVAFRLRWVAWEFVQSPFIIDGYRVNDHSATTTMQLYDLRKLIVTLYVQCIIYYTIKLPDVTQNISKLQPTLDVFGAPDFADLDPIFNKAFDDDFDEQICGITRVRFLLVYGEWIRFCIDHNNNIPQNFSEETLHNLRSLCFGLSLLGRRSLGYTYSDKSSLFQQSLTDVFLHGLHDVFKGDVRVSKDDWIFEDVTLLQRVITPAVRIALKLYQDNLANPLTALSDLHGAIIHTEKTHVICHETEPQWRFAILNDADSLFSFRRIVKPNSGDGYRIIMFNKKSLQFKVIKINRECVRGLWSSQQREQIFLRNNDQERGSIQHARQVLRNLVNSSCDLPIGYPIYVSPLTTSLAGSHLDLRKITGRELSLARIFSRIRRFWGSLQYRCTEACVPGPNRDRISKTEAIEMTKMIGSPLNPCPSTSCYRFYPNFNANTDMLDDKLQAVITKDKLGNDSNFLIPNKITDHSDSPSKLHKIVDGSQVLDRWHDKLSWPFEEWKGRIITGKTSSVALQGLEGQLIHKWTPFNPVMASRSFCHLTIGLLSFSNLNPATNLTDKLVLIFEKGLAEVVSTEEETVILEFV